MKTFKELNEITSGHVGSSSTLPGRPKTHYTATERSKGIVQRSRGGKAKSLHKKYQKRRKLGEMSKEANIILNEIAASGGGVGRFLSGPLGQITAYSMLQEPLSQASKSTISPFMRKLTYPFKAWQRMFRSSFPGKGWLFNPGQYSDHGPRALGGLDPSHPDSTREK